MDLLNDTLKVLLSNIGKPFSLYSIPQIIMTGKDF
jgi:hypothetical protein